MYVNIGSDGGLELIRRQTIIRTNDGLVCRRIRGSLGQDDLKEQLPAPRVRLHSDPLFAIKLLGDIKLRND